MKIARAVSRLQLKNEIEVEEILISLMLVEQSMALVDDKKRRFLSFLEPKTPHQFYIDECFPGSSVIYTISFTSEHRLKDLIGRGKIPIILLSCVDKN